MFHASHRFVLRRQQFFLRHWPAAQPLDNLFRSAVKVGPLIRTVPYRLQLGWGFVRNGLAPDLIGELDRSSRSSGTSGRDTTCTYSTSANASTIIAGLWACFAVDVLCLSPAGAPPAVAIALCICAFCFACVSSCSSGGRRGPVDQQDIFVVDGSRRMSKITIIGSRPRNWPSTGTSSTCTSDAFVRRPLGQVLELHLRHPPPHGSSRANFTFSRGRRSHHFLCLVPCAFRCS